MAKDEAIECLRNKKHCKDCKYYQVMIDNTIDQSCWDEAHEMAIESLEEAKKREETWEWCTDCKEYDQENHCCHRLNNVIHDTLCGAIVSGEWVPHETQVPWGDGTTDVTMFRCSVCGYEEDWQSRFCPNCGARMKGENNEE